MQRTKVYVVRDLSDLGVVELPSWQTQTLALLGDDVFAAKMLEASIGDPFETSTPASALADLRELEEDAGSTFDPGQWLLVSDESGEIGVVLPQLSQTDHLNGVLAYLAVMPDRRGHGLGRQLHQYGLQRLRELGALTYRGSTDAENAPMLAIFRANGCTTRAPHDVFGGDDARPVEVAYGRRHLAIPLPPGALPTVVSKAHGTPLPDPYAAVLFALDNPVGSAPLIDVARGRRTACIVICDITRPVPNGLFLRPLVDTMVAAGVPVDGITILVATGLHRPNIGGELAELVGDDWVLSHIRVENHDARDDSGLVDLGRTCTRGTPVQLNRRFVEADLRIVTGLVEPHFMAGWSGGRKVVAPGIAGQDTIRTFHSHRFMADPLAVQCNLDGNPLHTEQLEIIRMIGEVYAVNTVLDDERRLLDITFGDVIASHQSSVAFAEHLSHVVVPRRFSTVVTSAAGYPLDKTYYQTVKAMVTPLDILEPGGTLIVISECEEGLGSPDFAVAQALLAKLGPDAFLDQIALQPLAAVDEWQTQMLVQAQSRARILLFGARLTAAEQKLTCIEVVDDLEAAIAASISRGADQAVAVIPEGPYVVPVAT